MITPILIREDTKKLCSQKHLISLNSKASIILKSRERVTKIINFPKHASPSYYSTEKKERKRVTTLKTELRSLRLAGVAHP